ncbi:MAG: triphosphoribosyl-dephospho-CoA synthase [Verrucomicrobiota bacterium]
MEISPADQSLGGSAVEALLLELEAYPKPGLVSPRDSGAHADMDYVLMCRSANALLRPFASIAAAGREGGSFELSLIPPGLAAEREMLVATGGINTHRGAIFTLGMLVAAMARASARPTTPDGIRAVLLETWGDDLKAHASSDLSVASHGALVRRTTGTGGARAEAARGFPGVFETGLPVYREALASGLDPNAARIQTLFALMEATEDSNVIFRGGTDAADFVRRAAAEFLEAGGCRSDGWFARAEELHRTLIRRNLSPGGCADLLSGTLLVAGAPQ